MSESYSLGFRILGSTAERRRLVDHVAAFAGYAACDSKAEIEKEAYLSAFAFGKDFREHLTEHDSPKGFDGPCWSPFVWFDIDRVGDLEHALGDARRLAAFILERFKGLDEADLLAFFSGSKGFGIGLPIYWHAEPSAVFHRVCRRFAEQLASRAGIAIDPAIYTKTQPLRAPNSKHPKTGLHKSRLAFDELMGLSIAAIRDLAAEPNAFELPATRATNSDQASSDWREAFELVQREAEGTSQKILANGGKPTLNRLTLNFIRDGAGTGDRHRLAFSAACNLAEFGCPPDLAHALLSESALDSGLSPSDTRRQIECGLAFVKPVSTTAEPLDSEAIEECLAIETEGKPALPMQPPPKPPPGAVFHYHDAKGRPCEPSVCHIWTWQGAGRWYFAADCTPPNYTLKKECEES
jgi:hypothetical protein